MKCLKGHPWEACHCPQEEIDHLVNMKTLIAGGFCLLLAAIVWVAIG